MSIVTWSTQGNTHYKPWDPPKFSLHGPMSVEELIGTVKEPSSKPKHQDRQNQKLTEEGTLPQ